MEWLKDLFAQLKSKTVWGVLLLLLTQFTGLNADTITGILENLVDIVTGIGAILTLLGINHKLEKWLEVIKKKTPA